MEQRTIRHWPEEERPREKLQKYGSAALSNAEILAILLGSGSEGTSAVALRRSCAVCRASARPKRPASCRR